MQSTGRQGRENRKNRKEREKTKNKQADLSPNVSITALNISDLNIPIQGQGLAEWIKKQVLNTCCLQEIHFNFNDLGSLKAKGWRKIFHGNIKEKKVEVSILISGFFKSL